MRQSSLKKAAFGTLIGESLFTLGKLQGDPATADLVATMQPSHRGLKTAQAALIEVADEKAMAEGALQAALTGAHAAQTAVWLAAKTITGNSREPQPLMTHLFPHGLTGAKATPPAGLSNELKRLSAAIKDDGAAAPLAPHLRALAEQTRRLEGPLASLKEIELRESRAQAQATRARNDYLDARDVLYGALLARFPRQAGFCNSFYKKQAPAKSRAGAGGAAGGGAASGAPAA